LLDPDIKSDKDRFNAHQNWFANRTRIKESYYQDKWDQPHWWMAKPQDKLSKSDLLEMAPCH
jgi:hypothetical protein